MREWRLIKKIAGNHKFFRRVNDPENIYVADNSGPNPGETDDGPLILDTTRAIEFDDERGNYYIPVVVERDLQAGRDGNSRIVSTKRERDWVVSVLDFKMAKPSRLEAVAAFKILKAFLEIE